MNDPDITYKTILPKPLEKLYYYEKGWHTFEEFKESGIDRGEFFKNIGLVFSTNTLYKRNKRYHIFFAILTKYKNLVVLKEILYLNHSSPTIHYLADIRKSVGSLSVLQETGYYTYYIGEIKNHLQFTKKMNQVIAKPQSIARLFTLKGVR